MPKLSRSDRATVNGGAMIPLSPAHDPWDPLPPRRRYGRHVLTSVEVTVTELCNLRCAHCAIGEQLVRREPRRLPAELIIRRLDEVETLETFSVTGGEPLVSPAVVRELVAPLLRYARRRGLRTQINTHLMLDLERIEPLLEDLDVVHASLNALDGDAHGRLVLAHAAAPPPSGLGERLFERLLNNIQRLAEMGAFVSAETMMAAHTLPVLPEINRLLARLGARRHEIHPMYPSDFAARLPLLSIDELRAGIARFLDLRARQLWALFGTLPFFACSDDPADLALIARLRGEPNVTVRNDPDGRCRLNVSAISGDVRVSDFASFPPVGNILRDSLDEAFAAWREHPLCGRYDCTCLEANCTGPCPLVVDAYYSHWDFRQRRARLPAAPV